MSRILNVLLDKHSAVSEILLRLTRSTFQFLLQVLFPSDDVHAFAATTCRSLNQHRIRQLGGLFQNLLLASREAKSDGNAFLYGNVSSRNLIAHQANHFRIGTDENQVVGRTRFGQLGILGKEAVTRMDGIGTCIQSGIDDFLDIEIGVFQHAAAKRIGLVSHTAVQGIGIVIGKDRHRGNV